MKERYYNVSPARQARLMMFPEKSIMSIHLLAAMMLLLPGLVLAATSSTPKVVVSIKPIHSLVSAVMQDVAVPELLLQSHPDPHHFSLKPSQRKRIGSATLVVWVGPELETSLSKAIAQSRAGSLALLDSGLPDIYKSRGHEGNDPHIWLSPANAIHIARVVADALITLDAGNRKRYESNRDRLISRIDSLAAELEFEMSLEHKRYIAHHDAYQYFEKSFGLDGVGFIRNSHNEDAGFSTISKLSHMIELQTVNCIVYDASRKPGIIDSLGHTEKTRYSRIPNQGLAFNAGADLWFDMMKKMGRRFRQCLQ